MGSVDARPSRFFVLKSRSTRTRPNDSSARRGPPTSLLIQALFTSSIVATASGVAFLRWNFAWRDTATGRTRSTPHLDSPRRFWMARQVAGTLNAAHQRAVVHRDLKPDNPRDRAGSPNCLVVSGSNSLDFGVAKIAEGWRRRPRPAP